MISDGASALLYPSGAKAERPRHGLIALLLIAFGTGCLAAFSWAALDRLEFVGHRGALHLALLGLVGAILIKPLWGSYLLFFVIPFFGNHPGGRFMEVLNIPLSASVIGLAIHAWWRRLPVPRRRLWQAAAVYLLLAALALVPAIPGVLVQWHEINDMPISLVDALTASDWDPLYSVKSLVLVGLAIAWALGLAWMAPGITFARNAFRWVVSAWLAVVTVGVLDFHGVVNLKAHYRLLIDSRYVAESPFQSIFWNPGWFAWYFTIAFGVAVGLLWIETGYRRWLLGAALLLSYGYFFLTNSQRGGFLALHASLLALLGYAVVKVRRPKVRLAMGGLVLVLLVLTAAAAFRAAQLPEPWGRAARRLVAEPRLDPVRRDLAVRAIQMWRSAPVFGVGEGSFGWRLREYVPKGSPWDIGQCCTAHNTWLQILATRGLFGLCAYLLLLAAIAKRVVQALQAAELERRGIGLGVMLSFASFLTYSFFQYMFYLQSIQVLFWGLTALAVIASREAPERRKVGRGLRCLIGAAVVAVVLVDIWWSRPALQRAATELARQPSGFYKVGQWGPPDPPLRWSSREGTLCLYPSAPVMTLQMIVAPPHVAARPVTVSLRAAGHLLDQLEVSQPARLVRSYYLVEGVGARPTHEVPFGECVPGLEPLPLTVEVSHTWSPLSTGSGGDPRHLGVAVFAPEYSAAESLLDLGLSPWETDGGRQVRWTSAQASLFVTLAGAEATLVLPVRAINPDVSQHPVGVTLFWNERPMTSVSLSSPTWHELRLEVKDPARSGVLSVRVDRVWQPKAYGVGEDPRYLGVQTGRLIVQRKSD